MLQCNENKNVVTYILFLGLFTILFIIDVITVIEDFYLMKLYYRCDIRLSSKF